MANSRLWIPKPHPLYGLDFIDTVLSTEPGWAKPHASETVDFATDAALQIHGGYGFTREMPLERYVRDARILRI